MTSTPPVIAITARTSTHDSAHAFLVHEMRNLVTVAILSFEALKRTGAGVADDEGQVLRRSLDDLRTLINRSL